MDTYRGGFIDRHSDGDDLPGYDYGEDEIAQEPPPSPVGQDERRMQVRAYNHWASLLDNRNFPSIEDLDPEALPDFGPHSVLLDFTGGIENPSIQYLGDKLAEECGAAGVIETLADVPSRSLLSRITDHYMQILANQAPIGFEAEFVNQRERNILYRGILLPFSSNDDTIDFIYGVINWKELADQQTTDALLNEIDQALEVSATARHDDLITDWADGPTGEFDAAGQTFDVADEAIEDDSSLGLAEQAAEDEEHDDVLDLSVEAPDAFEDEVFELGLDVVEDDADLDEDPDVLDLAEMAEPVVVEALAAEQPLRREPIDLSRLAGGVEDDEDDYVPPPLNFSSQARAAAEAELEIALEVEVGTDMGLADWLASARELAEAARGTEDRSRQALYAAIGRAYDFSLAASEAPEEFAELVVESGLTVQDRAPMVPVVKLVFGADYDKTRITEYATALSHAHRVGLNRGALAGYLAAAQGGLKGVLGEERRLKREQSGQPAPARDQPRQALARKLRKLETFTLEDLPAQGNEFTLLVARRLPSGEVVLVGEIADDIPLLERAARKLVN
jgi:hypothetical protein